MQGRVNRSISRNNCFYKPYRYFPPPRMRDGDSPLPCRTINWLKHEAFLKPISIATSFTDISVSLREAHGIAHCAVVDDIYGPLSACVHNDLRKVLHRHVHHLGRLFHTPQPPTTFCHEIQEVAHYHVCPPLSAPRLPPGGRGRRKQAILHYPGIFINKATRQSLHQPRLYDTPTPLPRRHTLHTPRIEAKRLNIGSGKPNHRHLEKILGKRPYRHLKKTAFPPTHPKNTPLYRTQNPAMLQKRPQCSRLQQQTDSRRLSYILCHPSPPRIRPCGNKQTARNWASRRQSIQGSRRIYKQTISCRRSSLSHSLLQGSPFLFEYLP